MTDTRHVKPDLLNVIHNEVDWLAYKAPTHAHPIEVRYHLHEFSGKQTLHKCILVADKWFPEVRTHAIQKNSGFLGIFDLTGLGINCIIAERTFYANTNGAGTFLGINEVGGGIRITTAGASGNDNIFTDGDNNGSVYVWSPALQLYMHIDFRFPMIGDTEDVYLLGCLYQDGDNYVGIRYDPNGVYFPANPNMFFITRSGGVEQSTGLGAPEVGLWYESYIKIFPDEAWMVVNDRVVATHASYIPTGPLCFYVFLETQTDEAKRQDIRHVHLSQYDC